MIPRLVDRFLTDLPHPIGTHYTAYKEWRWGDPHVRSLKRLCDARRASIDVGANCGAYTYFLSKYSAHCYAFEPNPLLATQLRKRFPSAEVWAAAASDRAGAAVLRTPLEGEAPNFGRSTVEPASINRLEGAFTAVEAMAVETVRLDDVVRRSVGIIKIDVEGHELAVLNGCSEILARDRPNLIVELEERHHPGIVGAAFDRLHGLGYSGYFFFDGAVMSTRDFNISVHQNGNGGAYAWNFIFSVDESIASSLRPPQ
ncbi:MAG TPA: FkbM family methyltransferase [Stellaceae bacterium]|jgi:FkbM family methyltransferase